VTPAKVGVAFTWHCLAWEELASLVARAEELGFDTAYIDGDVSQLSRREADVLDGWTAATALIARTRRIRIISIRLVQRWNAAHLAQVAATAERIAPGRTHLFASIGDRPEDAAWGLPLLPARDRVAWLDETLDAVRALWRGESVTRRGSYVALDGARVRPVPPGGALPIEVGAKGPRLLAVVARHADVWNINWPAIPARVDASAAELARACRALGRDPGSIRRRLWIFTRPEPLSPGAAVAEFRRWNPWFRDLSEAEVAPALAVGKPAECRERIAALAAGLDLEMPVLDLSGLDPERAREALEALPAGDIR
jgi:alkanesulfonate monooxygenase SsuD/methylene tetrahydromethanopterin reductase-like flavin-dependent oxidoreductase (luciferase family)